MTEVVKKNSSREPFDEDKIKEAIRRASREAKINLERANELIRLVSEHGHKMSEEGREISSQDIRKKILEELDMEEPDIVKAWKDYEKIKPSKK